MIGLLDQEIGEQRDLERRWFRDGLAFVWRETSSTPRETEPATLKRMQTHDAEDWGARVQRPSSCLNTAHSGSSRASSQESEIGPRDGKDVGLEILDMVEDFDYSVLD